MPHRGDIWFADLGCHPGTSIQAGCRPVFIVSNDIGNTHAETLNVLPMTRHLKKLGLPCHGELNPGIVEDTRQEMESSMILAEQVTTISKLQLRNYVGRVEDTELLAAIEQAICEQFSLAGPGHSDAKYIHNEMKNKECDCNDHM
jgi:mRNA interferase MazF